MIRPGDVCMRIFACCPEGWKRVGRTGPVLQLDRFNNDAFGPCDCGFAPPAGVRIALFNDQVEPEAMWICAAWLKKMPPQEDAPKKGQGLSEEDRRAVRRRAVPLRVGDVWVQVGPETEVVITGLRPRPTVQKPRAQRVTLDDGRTIAEATLRYAYMRRPEYDEWVREIDAKWRDA